MKTQLTACFLFFTLAATSAFAADLGPGEGIDTKFDSKDLVAAGDFAARNEDLGKIVKSNKQFDENVALVNQITANGNTVFAYVDQGGGQGNLAIVMQDARVNPAVAIVFQSGSGGRAIINQH